MRPLILVLTFLLSATFMYGQYDEAIKRDGATYNKALVSKDYETYVNMSIPAIVAMGGGKASMISVAKEHEEMYKQNNMSIESIEVEGIGEVYNSKDALHVVIGQRKIIKLGDKRFESISSYLAESKDDGNTWKFLDLEPYDKESLSLFMPDISADLIVPGVGEALEIKD